MFTNTPQPKQTLEVLKIVEITSIEKAFMYKIIMGLPKFHDNAEFSTILNEFTQESKNLNILIDKFYPKQKTLAPSEVNNLFMHATISRNNFKALHVKLFKFYQKHLENKKELVTGNTDNESVASYFQIILQELQNFKEEVDLKLTLIGKKKNNEENDRKLLTRFLSNYEKFLAEIQPFIINIESHIYKVKYALQWMSKCHNLFFSLENPNEVTHLWYLKNEKVIEEFRKAFLDKSQQYIELTNAYLAFIKNNETGLLKTCLTKHKNRDLVDFLGIQLTRLAPVIDSWKKEQEAFEKCNSKVKETKASLQISLDSLEFDLSVGSAKLLKKTNEFPTLEAIKSENGISITLEFLQKRMNKIKDEKPEMQKMLAQNELGYLEKLKEYIIKYRHLNELDENLKNLNKLKDYQKEVETLAASIKKQFGLGEKISSKKIIEDYTSDTKPKTTPKPGTKVILPQIFDDYTPPPKLD